MSFHAPTLSGLSNGSEHVYIRSRSGIIEQNFALRDIDHVFLLVVRCVDLRTVSFDVPPQEVLRLRRLDKLDQVNSANLLFEL